MLTLADLAPQQRQAYDRIIEWYEGPDQLFYLAGWAGTGKSSIASFVANELVGLESAVFGAYTAKAALVMRERGCPAANTMHYWMYQPADSVSREKLHALEDALDALRLKLAMEGYEDAAIAEHPEVSMLEGSIYLEVKKLRKPRFKLDPASVVKDRPLGYLDEVSMVNAKMGCDWLSFGQKTLVTGDPAQLPPVGGEGYFTSKAPNFMLTDIHRQALDNPIIKLSTMLRNGERPKPGLYGNSRVIRQCDISADALRILVMESEQVIVGRNATRHAFNNRIRQLRRYEGRFPNVGETIVCLRNDNELGLINGGLYVVREVLNIAPEIDRIDLLIEPSGGGCPMEVHCHSQHFEGKEKELDKAYWTKLEAQEFDFGYALTCHKVQGSQFKNPVIFDESASFGANWSKWLYTAVTRAIDSFTLVV